MNHIAMTAAAALLLSTPVLAADDEIKPDAAAGQQKAMVCAACHGADGNSMANPEWPTLAGQHADYIAKQLRNYRAGAKNPDGDEVVRVNAIMNGQAANLSDQDIADLSAYFAAQTPKPQNGANPDFVALGETLWRAGDLQNGIPACASCHGPGGTGNPQANFPSLYGQHATYTRIQLEHFRSMARANDAGRMMRNIAVKLSDAQIEALSSYIQGLRPTEVSGY